MAKYIDADVLMKWVREFYPKEKQFQSAIINAPAANVAEVVRCSNCRDYKLRGGSFYCVGVMQHRCPDDFCSYGERKDGDEK